MENFSSFNLDEVSTVMEFVEMLLEIDTITQTDIGIVTPYKLQCKILKQNCEKKNYKDIIIGSAEVFQGQEKSVMIVSTVRSGRTKLGDFLANAQVRFMFFLIFYFRINFKTFYFVLLEIQCDAYEGTKFFDSRWRSTFAVNKFKLERIY